MQKKIYAFDTFRKNITLSDLNTPLINVTIITIF